MDIRNAGAVLAAALLLAVAIGERAKPWTSFQAGVAKMIDPGHGALLTTAGPGGMILHAGSQKLLGKPRTCVATWLKIKLVLIGAT